MKIVKFNFAVFPTRHYVGCLAVVSAMGGLLFGYDWVVIGGVKPFHDRVLKENRMPIELLEKIEVWHRELNTDKSFQL